MEAGEAREECFDITSICEGGSKQGDGSTPRTKMEKSKSPATPASPWEAIWKQGIEEFYLEPVNSFIGSRVRKQVATTRPHLSKMIEDLTTSAAQHGIVDTPRKDEHHDESQKKRNRYYKHNSIWGHEHRDTFPRRQK